MLCASARTGVAQEAEAAPPLSDPDAAELDRAARSLFEAGKIAFDLGRYEEALEYLQQAHDLSQRPILLFNIASTLDRLRRDQEALDTFERYLREVPDAANKLAVEGRVRLLREVVERAKAEEAARQAVLARQREAAAAQEAPAPTAPTNPGPAAGVEDTSGGGLSPVVFFVTGGATVIVGALAVFSGLNTLSARDQYEEYAKTAPPGEESMRAAKTLYDDGVSRELRTNVLIGATALLGVGTAVVALLTDWGGGETEAAPVAASAFLSPEGAGLTLNGNF